MTATGPIDAIPVEAFVADYPVAVRDAASQLKRVVKQAVVDRDASLTVVVGPTD